VSILDVLIVAAAMAVVANIVTNIEARRMRARAIILFKVVTSYMFLKHAKILSIYGTK
jgi:hypothetical protein